MTEPSSNPPAASASPSRQLILVAAFLLFVVWSNGFIAGSFLLGGERGAARFDATGLVAARFALVTPVCLVYSFAARRRVALQLLRRFPVRTVVAALLSTPIYSLALFFGQQNGVPAPVAALTTALTPLFLMILAALFLGERLSPRKGLAFLIALAGLVTIAWSRSAGDVGDVADYALILGVTALAPLTWSIYSILSKPATAIASPLDWTYLTLGLGGLPLLFVLPWRGGPELAALDRPGWAALLYMSVLGTLGGYAVWSWLLRHLPASTIGFFTFLNPPLTALSKVTLATFFPAVFAWHTNRLELAGAALALCGLALALWPASARGTKRSKRPLRA